jgi:uncharacterized protein (TIGR01777 family)
MRVIITGGAGLIGRALAANLAGGGHEVIALSRGPARVREMPAGVRLAKWDARSAAGWGAMVDGAGAVINLAGEQVAGPNPFTDRWTPARKARILQSRVNAGRAVVEAVEAAANRPGVVIQVSGSNYYGTPGGDAEITEDAPPGDDYLAGVCVQWEDATAPVEALGVRRVVFRMGPVLDPGGGALPPMLLQFRLFAGGALGSGAQWFPWVHPADVIGAVKFALAQHKDAAGVFNLSAPGVLTNHAFAKALGRVMGRPVWLPAPGFAMRLLFGEMAVTLLKGQRMVPRRLLDAGYTFRFPEAEPALRDLLK